MTSKQTIYTENPGVSLGSANSTGGGHTFGNTTRIDDNSNNKGIFGAGSNNIVNSGDNSGNKTYIGSIFNTIAGNGSDANKLKHQLITTLPRAKAGRNERQNQGGPCFKGTRQALLREIKDWATNPNEAGMYVLSGLAGIGKSTIAYTMATWAADDRCLGAEFFFSRDEADRRNAKLFFTTIAHDLYYFDEKFKRAIGEALVTSGSTAITGNLQDQLDDLILHPLMPIRNTLPPTLIVVDALDECDDDDAHFVFTALCRVVQALPSFKVILTTRPEALSKDDSTTEGGRKVFRLHDIDADVINEDIRIYLKYCLSAEQVNERLPDLKEPWCASDAQVERLVQASGKLFIMASTAVRYILDEHQSTPDPDRQIKTLLDTFAQGRTPFNNLIDFYTIILRNAVPVNCDDTRLVERYQAIIGTIVLAQVPLSVHSIASFIDIGIGRISEVLRQLQSVIFVADNGIPRAYHKSFVDFITDSTRCEDINLRIDLMKHYTWIATRCFEMMSKHLKVNILGLGIPTRYMSNEKGLAKDGISNEKLQEKIPLGLQYACAYWGDHLNSANIDNADLVKALEKFDNARALLPWIEVLSLIRKLDSAPHTIRVALKVLKPTSSDLRQLLSDGLRFICKFYEIIERSALQTYCSALLFTPTDTLLYRRYINEGLHRGCNVIGIPTQWDAVIANFRHEDWTQHIQFSLDSTMIVTWCCGLLKVWDAVTGTPISTIKNSHKYSQFANANDFFTIVSFVKTAITLYKVNGNEQGVTLTTSADVLRVAISSKSVGRIAAGLRDGTVSLWDIQDGKPICSFWDYRKYSSLEFSATGTRLAYLSAKYRGIVKLWDAIKGEFVANLDWGLPDFAFSRDGSRIVSWQWNGVKLWDCGDGQPVGTVEQMDVRKVAISDNGSLLAIRCYNSVKLWSVNRENCLSHVEDLDLESSLLASSLATSSPLAFSQDDILVISTRAGVKFYNIKNRSFIYTFSNSSCIALACSPDGTRFVVGYNDRTISLLDIQVIKSSSPSSNQSSELTQLALSRDCSRVACGFKDGTVELWETDDFPRRRIATHRPHEEEIVTIGFSPDGRQFTSGSIDGTINLWDDEAGVQRIDLQYSPVRGDRRLYRVEVSNGVLAAAGNYGITLWDCKTLDCVQSSNGNFMRPSFSADGALLAAITRNSKFAAVLTMPAVTVAVIFIASMVVAVIPVPSMLVAVRIIIIAAMLVTIIVILIAAVLVAMIITPSTLVTIPFIVVGTIVVAVIEMFKPALKPYSITVFDVTNHTAIATFNIDQKVVRKMVFVPDNSQLIVWMPERDLKYNILTFNLLSKKTIQGPSFETFFQLSDMPLWHGVPVWVDNEHSQYYLAASFSQLNGPVPVLWIPRELHALEFIQRRSMIVIRCQDRRVVFLRLPTTATGV